MSQPELVGLIKSCYEQVKSDLQTFKTTNIHPCKPLKRKSGWTPVEDAGMSEQGGKVEDSVKEPRGAKAVKVEDHHGSIKSEVSIKVERKDANVEAKNDPGNALVAHDKPPDTGEVAHLEDIMGKHDLVALHGLQILPKNTCGKKKGVKCPHCDKVFEEPNRAKIKQHTDGDEHRAKWKRSDKENIPPPLSDCPELAADTKKLIQGTCQGLRLSGTFGRKTRLGSDLHPVWLTYSKFASMERTVVFFYMFFGCLVVGGCFKFVFSICAPIPMPSNLTFQKSFQDRGPRRPWLPHDLITVQYQ